VKEKEMMSKIEVETKHLLNAYSAVEKARMELYWALNHQIRAGKEPSNILPPDDVKVEILDSGEIVKLTVMDYPARFKTIKDKEKERWINNVMFALKRIRDKVSFDRVFIFIKFYFPDQHIDVDNRDIKSIIDGIKYAGVIADDSYKYVSYGFNARFSSKPKTEIFIIRYENFPEKLYKILNEG